MAELNVLPILHYIIGMFDPAGIEHSQRVTALCVSLCEKVGLKKGSDELNDISLAASLHDLGKMGVPESVRRQMGDFIEGERLLMETHANIGARILHLSTNGKINEDVVKMVRHHHENWSGTGYPDGLAGENIPYGSRVIRICDSYDAATHSRGYRHPMEKADALQDLEDSQIRGAVYDPKLLRAFLEMMRIE